MPSCCSQQSACYSFPFGCCARWNSCELGNEEEDHWEWHMYDTVKGSDYLADQEAVEILAKEAPNAIIALEHMGVPFSRNMQGKIEQRRFGGHTKNYR